MKKLFLFSLLIFLSAGSFAQLFKSNKAATTSTCSTTLLLLTTALNNSLLEDTPSQPVLLNYHSGIAVTNNKDTLKGNIRLYENDEISMIIKRNGLNVDTLLDASDVKIVRLYASDSLLNSNSYTDYVRLNNRKYLLRQVYKGDFELYDDLYSSNEYPGKTGDYIVVQENGSAKTLTGSLISNPRKNMIEYVNGRYSKTFRSKDFARVIDVINWIRLNG